MSNIEFKDIQGLIIRGHSNLQASNFLLLQVTNLILAQQWLKDIGLQITDGETKPDNHAIQIGFTYKGLKALKIPDDSLNTFAREFQEGMVTEHRKRLLGDLGDSDPEKWIWGSPKTDEIHMVLMFYTTTVDALNVLHDDHVKKLKGVKLIITLDCNLPTVEKRKEHFGFHDGISQPIIKGFSKQGSPQEMVEPGEFILGYINEYGNMPESPMITVSGDPNTILPITNNGSNNYDLGKNGSYMVFRQISQDVLKFWKYMQESSGNIAGNSDEEKRVRLASKMVGRWPSGAPLVESPDHDDITLSDVNSFNYSKSDPDGLKCPFGSHIRRTNPRDSLDPTPQDSNIIIKRHQILRRGRPYGHFIPSNDPLEIANSEKLKERRGLHFICFNTNLSRQFEFIQNTWVNNSKFAGLYNDGDPISGNPMGRCKADTSDFTIQAYPVRERIINVPVFTTIVGGAYFFMPGINALKYITLVK